MSVSIKKKLFKKEKKKDQKTFRQKAYHVFKYEKQLIILALPMVLYYFFFHYLPLYGLQIAFKDYSPFIGIWESPWNGLDNFEYLITGVASTYFLRSVKNTLVMNFYDIIFGFPIPIILALLFNELKSAKFRKVAQTAMYLPHFISLTVICGMTTLFLSPASGIVNEVLQNLGLISKPIYFLMEADYYRTIYIGTGIWQDAGFNSIIYFAALLGISPSLYEAAKVDGANKFQQMFYITLPGITPTIIIMFIIKIGNILKIGFEKTLLLYQPATYEVSDVMGSYVYRIGLAGSNEMDIAAAAGLLENLIGISLVIIANSLSRKYSETSLW